jgi:hypothetical protein
VTGAAAGRTNRALAAPPVALRTAFLVMRAGGTAERRKYTPYRDGNYKTKPPHHGLRYAPGKTTSPSAALIPLRLSYTHRYGSYSTKPH